jgi:hypothetical protein
LPAEEGAAPADLARWLPRRGYSQFASGFTPLEPKTLGSILDVERAKGLSPEHLVAAWDDVSALSPLSVSSLDVYIFLSPLFTAIEEILSDEHANLLFCLAVIYQALTNLC